VWQADFLRKLLSTVISAQEVPHPPVTSVIFDRGSNAMNSQETTILYVDDDELSRTTVSRRLRRMGIRVLEANSAESAFSYLGTEDEIDLLLLEPAVNQLFGLELYRTLMSQGRFLATVICTAAVEEIPEEVLQASKLPADCYCRKPCSFNELLLCIQTALKQSPTATEGA